MHANHLMHPWQSATTWTHAHPPHLPHLRTGREHHDVPSRFEYFEAAAMSRMMDSL